jgi:hypothetical protein
MPGDEFYVIAFWRLNTERQVGMSVGPIPHSKCVEYAILRGVCQELLDHFCDVMRAMDEAYRDWMEKGRPKPPPTKPQPGKMIVRGKSGG